MTILGIVLGTVLMIAVAVGIALAPPVGDSPPFLLKLGRGRRRWWVLAGATAVTLLVGVAAGLSTSDSHPFTLLLVLGVAVPLLLACAWAWGRVRSFA
ncbi:MAG TPA: hypothetical protein VNF24_03845 [Candidatus Acidoferrales bacterium]|nr:hypothetical protein [Candidatus Acidoferrales bacterium]